MLPQWHPGMKIAHLYVRISYARTVTVLTEVELGELHEESVAFVVAIGEAYKSIHGKLPQWTKTLELVRTAADIRLHGSIGYRNTMGMESSHRVFRHLFMRGVVNNHPATVRFVSEGMDDYQAARLKLAACRRGEEERKRAKSKNRYGVGSSCTGIE